MYDVLILYAVPERRVLIDILTMLSGHYEEIGAILLFVIGMLNLVLQSNMIKMIIGLNMMDVAVFLFLAANG